MFVGIIAQIFIVVNAQACYSNLKDDADIYSEDDLRKWKNERQEMEKRDSMQIEWVKSDEVPQVMALMKEVYEQMPDKTWFFMDEDSVLRKYILEEGFCLKAVVENQIAGVFIACYPGKSEDNLGGYMQFGEEELMRTAHMEIAMVRSGYRGLGIQKKLMEQGEKELKDKGYRYLMGTAHPDNIYSVRNFERLGYQVVAEELKYGGWPRYVFYKEI